MTTTELMLAAVILAGISFCLFVVTVRRLLERQEQVTVTMLRRYDERLASFAQALGDALATFQASPSVLPASDLDDDPEPMLRALELARERTHSDGAIALVAGGSGTPIVATVGLSESETNHMARMGYPDYRGARAIEVAFAGDLPAPAGSPPVRSGLVVPLLDEDEGQSLLGVLTREQGRRFSEDDVDSLAGVVRVARSPVTRALNLRPPDVVPEIDVLTNLLDRQSFSSVLEREIARARLTGQPLSLLVVDVDRLETLSATRGIEATDAMLVELVERIRGEIHHLDYVVRLGGGRFAVLRPGSEAVQARDLYRSIAAGLKRNPLVGTTPVTVSGGVSVLAPRDDASSFAARADAALASAQRTEPGTVVIAAEDRAFPAPRTLEATAIGSVFRNG